MESSADAREAPRRRGPGIVTVSGDSMEPTLRNGDHVLLWWGARPAPDRLAVFPHPEAKGVLAVKRLVRRDPNDSRRWWVERDNPRAGSDSWSFGSIAEQDILALVVVRLPLLRARR